MDTKKDSSTSDVPTFKVARVGEDRKRKGGAFSFLRGGGARGVWRGAAGGAGAGGAGAGGAAALLGGGMSFSNALIMALIAAGALGAISLGRMMSGSSGGAKPKTFSMASHDAVKLEGDTSNLQSNSNTIPNSLGYLSGSMDGMTPEERAKKAADAAAAAEAQRIADEEAAKKAEAERLAGSPAVDPGALLASAKGDGGAPAKGAGFGSKFGALSSSMGGGASLSGGAGMSGGVNRQFGSAGSLGKSDGGKLSASKGDSRASSSKAAGSRLARSKMNGFAKKQLANASGYSRRGAGASKGETASSDAATAFDNNPGGGSVISGPGIGKGAGPANGGGASANPGGDGGGGGGSTGDKGTECGDGEYPDGYGSCKAIPVPKGVSGTPMVDMLCKMAMALLAAIAVISVIKAALDGTFVGAGYAAALGGIIGAMGVMIALMGVAILAMGMYIQGTVFTAVGAFIGAVAFVPGMSSILTAGTMVIASAAGMVMGQAAKMLEPKKKKAPAAAGE